MSNERRNNSHWVRRLIALSVGVLLIPIVLLLVIPFVLLRLFIGIVLNVLVWIRWCVYGKDILFVCSDSPIWQDYVANQIIPRIQTRSIILNWSEGRHWITAFSLEATGGRPNRFVLVGMWLIFGSTGLSSLYWIRTAATELVSRRAHLPNPTPLAGSPRQATGDLFLELVVMVAYFLLIAMVLWRSTLRSVAIRGRPRSDSE